MTRTCPHCRQSVAGQAKFCPSCGGNLPAIPVRPGAGGTICPQCGHLNLANAKFCGSCGAVVEARPSVKPPSPAGTPMEPSIPYAQVVQVVQPRKRSCMPGCLVFFFLLLVVLAFGAVVVFLILLQDENFVREMEQLFNE